MSEIAKPRGLRALYAWMLKNAQGRHAWAALACFAFAEASFFPIPPDVMLLPMMVANRRRAFALAAWCTLFSVLGGALGYAIGALFWDTAGQWIIHALHIPLEKVEHYRQSFSAHAYMIVVQGMTPIPYKLVTIASGLAGVPFLAFHGVFHHHPQHALHRAGRAAGAFLRRPGQGAARQISRSRADRLPGAGRARRLAVIYI